MPSPGLSLDEYSSTPLNTFKNLATVDEVDAKHGMPSKVYKSQSQKSKNTSRGELLVNSPHDSHSYYVYQFLFL